jgi:hypothetical protein
MFRVADLGYVVVAPKIDSLVDRISGFQVRFVDGG